MFGLVSLNQDLALKQLSLEAEPEQLVGGAEVEQSRNVFACLLEASLFAKSLDYLQPVLGDLDHVAFQLQS